MGTSSFWVSSQLSPKHIFSSYTRYAPVQSEGDNEMVEDIVLSPTPAQLDALVPEIESVLVSFAGVLAAADEKMLYDQFTNGFWKAHRDAWHTTLRAYPDAAPAFVSAWLQVAQAGKLKQLEEPYLTYAALWDTLPAAARDAIRDDLATNPQVSRGWYYVDRLVELAEG